MKLILAALLLVPTALVAAPPSTATATATAATTTATAGASTWPASAGVAAPVHTFAVTGPGIATYPAFDPSVARYGITSTEASTGTVEVTATTSDPAGKVFIDGRLAPKGTRTVKGLAEGDEVSVIFDDAAGRMAHSAIYLPSGFPTLERTTPPNTSVADGQVLLTLSKFTPGAVSHETAVDRNGVPVHVHTEPGSLDFKRQPNGKLSASRASGASPDRTGSAVVELGADLAPVKSHETVGLKNTDGHDSILAADGSTYLVAYEPSNDGYLDAVIQRISPSGEVTFEWNAADHVDIPNETVLRNDPDYAHINSIVITADNNLIASFRHFSAVFKIALRTEDGHQAGDVLWRLGGHRSDFDFVDDPHYGPCAQHTASELPNGNILIFDNGSYGGELFGTFCIDPANPTGPEITRNFTRITEYALDETAGTATLVSSFTEPDRAALFAGGVEQIDNGNRIIGWASSRAVTATELSATGEKLWELRATNPVVNDRPFTYRAHVTSIPDAITPVVSLPVKQGHEYHRGQVARPSFSCTDRGGSSLESCVTTGIVDDRLDTSRTGTHTVTVTATDGAGNTSTVSRSYVVVADRPDAMLKAKGDKKYVGNNVYGRAARQKIVQQVTRSSRTAVTVVRLQNDGELADRMWVTGTAGNGKFRVVYHVGGRNVTAKVVSGTFRTPALAPGKHLTMKLKVTRTNKAGKGDERAVKVRAGANHDSTYDTVKAVIRAR